MNEDRLNQLEKRLEKLVDPSLTEAKFEEYEADFEYWRDTTEWTRPRPIEDIVDEDDFEKYFNEED